MFFDDIPKVGIRLNSVPICYGERIGTNRAKCTIGTICRSGSSVPICCGEHIGTDRAKCTIGKLDCYLYCAGQWGGGALGKGT